MRHCLLLFALLVLAACVSTAPPQKPAAEAPQFFHIEPVRPVAELLPIALAATPPVEHGDFRHADLVELTALDPTIKLDIRYATTRNFLGTPLYSQARAFLQRPAAEALVRVQKSLAAEGYGLLVHDAYRPWYVTKIFWDATPPDKHKFVADPATGSRHNRGCAVDLTLYTLRDGQPVEMPSLYDEMSERAYPTYTGGTDEQRRLRELLRRHMEAEGFSVYEFEWWHFDYRDWKSYALQNVRFEDIAPSNAKAAHYDETDPSPMSPSSSATTTRRSPTTRARLDFELLEDTPRGPGKRWVLVAPPGNSGTSLLLAKAANAEQQSRIGNQTGGRVFLFLHTDDFAARSSRHAGAGRAFRRGATS